MPPVCKIVFLLVIAGLSSVSSQKKAKPCEKAIKRGGWGGGRGACFGTADSLQPRDRCDSIIYNNTISGCPDEVADPFAPAEACCVNCAKQTQICHRRYAGSIGSSRPCCPGYFEVMTAREGSGCVCCKQCRVKPRTYCKRRQGHHCITKEDPVYNEDWCMNSTDHISPKIYKRGCTGWGCWCCGWDNP